MTLASGLVQVKFVDWLGKTLTPHVQGFSTPTTLLLVVGSFFALHYLFASLTAHTTALLPVYLTVAAGVAAATPSVSPKIWGLTLAYTLGIMGIITPYATGPSPIYFGSGYVTSKAFWIYGAILGAVFLGTLLFVGVPWMMWMGILSASMRRLLARRRYALRSFPLPAPEPLPHRRGVERPRIIRASWRGRIPSGAHAHGLFTSPPGTANAGS